MRPEYDIRGGARGKYYIHPETTMKLFQYGVILHPTEDEKKAGKSSLLVLGIATVLCGAAITKAAPNTGDLINATTAGVVDDPTVQEIVPNSLGIALDPPNPDTKIRVILSYLPALQG